MRTQNIFVALQRNIFNPMQIAHNVLENITYEQYFSAVKHLNPISAIQISHEK